jgi:hypothetical protein
VFAIEVTSGYNVFTQGLKKSIKLDFLEVMAGRTVDRGNGKGEGNVLTLMQEACM